MGPSFHLNFFSQIRHRARWDQSLLSGGYHLARCFGTSFPNPSFPTPPFGLFPSHPVLWSVKGPDGNFFQSRWDFFPRPDGKKFPWPVMHRAIVCRARWDFFLTNHGNRPKHRARWDQSLLSYVAD